MPVAVDVGVVLVLVLVVLVVGFVVVVEVVDVVGLVVVVVVIGVVVPPQVKGRGPLGSQLVMTSKYKHKPNIPGMT